MINQKLGRVAVAPKGEWSAGTYTRLDVVTHGGQGFICSSSETSEEPGTGSAWQLIATKGRDFTYSDFTEEQIAGLMKPATDAATEIGKTNDEYKAMLTEQAKAFGDAQQARAVSYTDAERARDMAYTKAETDRNAAYNEEEGKRQDSERVRGENEGSRKSAEQTRSTAENERAEAEVGRKQAEQTRDTAETKRDTAEKARVKAEGEREQGWTDLKAEAEKSVGDVHAAIAEVKATEARLYPVAENVLRGTAKDTFVHVDDAFAGAALREITVEGACKQDGTPSPDNPVPIQVIENPTLKVTGRNLLDYTRFGGVYYADVGTRLDDTTEMQPLTESSQGFYATRDMTSWNEPHLFTTAPLHAGQYVLSFAIWSETGAGAYTFYTATSDYVVTRRVEGFQASNSEWTSARKKTISQAISVSDGERICLYVNVNGALGAVTKHFVIEQPMVTAVSGMAYAPYTSQSLPITLPAEHPYLAKLPDGTADTIEVDKDGNVTLVANVKRYKATGDESLFYDNVNNEFYINSSEIGLVGATGYSDKLKYTLSTRNTLGFAYGNGNQIYMSVPGVTTDYDTAVDWVRQNTPLFYGRANESKTYQLGKITVPSLPDSISNVWTDAEVTPKTGIEYTRDVNIAFANIEDAIASITQG